MTNELLRKTFRLEHIDSVASEFVRSILILTPRPVIIGYLAEMGTGKTTFTRAMLYALGVDSREPVLSPTFTYIQEYETPSGLWGHLDLYRLDSAVDLEELIGRSIDAYRGLLIEWPESGGGLKHLGCRYVIEASICQNQTERTFSLIEYAG